MKRQLLTCIILLSCWYITALFAQSNEGLRTAERVYKQALDQFNLTEPNERTDSVALASFTRVLSLVKPSQQTAPMLYNSALKAGILNQTYNRQTEALRNYQRAIKTGRGYSLADSMLFKPYLYAGMAHYHLHAFDSSTYYYKKAEQIYLRCPHLSEAQRLYNSFGVIYYEAGNYQQSINYFQKALQLNQQNRKAEVEEDFQIRYTSNIASALRHLEQYESAAQLYKKLLARNSNRTELLINLGMTYLEKKDPDQALLFLRKIKNGGALYPVMYQNALARAYTLQQQYDLATQHLHQALHFYKQQHSGSKSLKKNANIGLTYKLLGDLAAQRQRYAEAARAYQQAIIQLDFEFNDTALNRNPGQFTEGFASFILFETIASKAACLQEMAVKKQAGVQPINALDAYRSALTLADRIQKSFDTEEARLFVVNKVFPVHQKTVALLMQLYEQTRNESFLEEAFRRSEQSKAAVLYIGQKENENKANTGIPDSLLQEERNLKFALSQLFLQSDRATSDKEISLIRSKIRDNELALSRLSDRLHDYPEYYRKKFGEETIDINRLRQKVLNDRTALLSYFQTEQVTYTFVLTQKSLRYYQTPNNRALKQALTQLISGLKDAEPGETNPVARQSRFLYDRLIKPLEKDLTGCSSLIIIPHNQLTQLSFDVLENASQKYLIEYFDITYQYSAYFLRSEAQPTLSDDEVLMVAPFSGPYMGGPFESLPASAQEVSSMDGTKLISQAATKRRFMQLANQASVIHLATHAVANNEFPARSFIAFSPQPNQSDRLYAYELQYGVLAQAKLIFLSACETASGQLVRGEGVMSLSRALSYAGCPNLITSLWKAEDQATAFISARFYNHLQKGNSIARSLQLAKIDLLNEGSYAQFHSPQYWSHLVFVGSPSKPQLNESVVKIAILILMGLGAGIGIWRWVKQKKVTVIAQ